MAARSRTTVVLPFDPVTRTVGTSCTRLQSTLSGPGSDAAGQAITPLPDPAETSSSSLKNWSPRLRAASRRARRRGLRSAAMRARSRSTVRPKSGAGVPRVAASAASHAASLTSVAA